MPNALVLAALLLALVAGESSPAAASGLEWSQDPIRWILTNGELRQWRDLSVEAEQNAFREDVWRRRDPTPGQPGNRHQESFYHRVEEADALFGDESRTGSLTERGRAYILLGPPSQIVQGQRKAPSFSPASTLGRAQKAPRIVTEKWLWRPGDLAKILREELSDRHWRPRLEVRFRMTSEGYSLEDGEDLLRAALRSLLRPSSPEP